MTPTVKRVIENVQGIDRFDQLVIVVQGEKGM